MGIDAYLRRYRQGLRRFATKGKRALQYGAIEKRIYQVFGKRKKDRYRLYRGAIRIRYQQGMADEFKKGVVRARGLLKPMESAFRAHKVPAIITRLAFVESMFNPKARSRRGAVGIWQFMPTTAKQYLVVNQFLDERLSPLKAAEAAAKLLASNYKQLGSWPLAITAYNQGVNRVKAISSKMRTTNLSRIVRQNHPASMGFAGRNFYAEFLAAVRVYDRIADLQKHEWNPLVWVTVRQPLTPIELTSLMPIDISLLASMNGCLKKKVLDPLSTFQLPEAYKLLVPRSLVGSISKRNQFSRYIRVDQQVRI